MSWGCCPARIVGTLDIDLPHPPRRRQLRPDRRFAALQGRLRALLAESHGQRRSVG